MNLFSRESLIARLRKGKARRSQFVESHLTKGIAYQIRAIRDRLGWTQERLAAEIGMPQNAISRLESPDYGKSTLRTLRRIAAAFDVALVVRFVPFSEMVDWVSATPRIQPGLSDASLAAPCFEEEERIGVFQRPPATEIASFQRIMSAEGSGCTVTEATGVGRLTVGCLTETDVAIRKPPRSSNELRIQDLTHAS